MKVCRLNPLEGKRVKICHRMRQDNLPSTLLSRLFSLQVYRLNKVPIKALVSVCNERPPQQHAEAVPRY